MMSRRRMPALLALLTAGFWLLGLAGCVNAPLRSDPAPQTQSLEAWIDTELSPYLQEQLAKHPRFKGEPVLLVRMAGVDVQPDIDDLSAEIRDRIFDALLRTPGVNLVWRPTTGPWGHHRSLTELRCRPNPEPHYYLGVDPELTPDGDLRVTVRALDLRDGTWVSGFGKTWRGLAGSAQRRALASRHPDAYLRGLRVLPFGGTEADLAAAYLARNLGCLLREQGAQDAAIYPEPPASASPYLRTALELVGNYLGRFPEIHLSDDPARAELILHGEVHRIHGDLYQLWAILRQREGGRRVAGTDTSTYVRLAGPAVADAPATGSGSRQPEPLASGTPAGEQGPLLAPIRVLAPKDQNLCHRTDPWAAGAVVLRPGDSLPPRGCYALELELRAQAALFLLAYDADTGLVRLRPAACPGAWGAPGWSPPGTRLRFPGPRAARTVLAGEGRAGVTSYYAIAVSDPAVAGSLEHQLGRIPEACPGQSGNARQALPVPEHWLGELRALEQAHPQDVQWQAVRLSARRER